MRNGIRLLAVGLAAAGVLTLAACGGGSSGYDDSAPATVEEIKGSELSRVTLTERAAQRLRIATATVRARGSDTVVPYAALLYTAEGDTWTYTSPKPLTFIRKRVVVARIDGNEAILSSGPAVGTKVATVGVAELYGAESGLG